MLLILDNVCSVEVDLQLLQLEAINGDREEASNGRGTGVFGTWASEEKVLQLRHGHSELGDVLVIQIERAQTLIASITTPELHE